MLHVENIANVASDLAAEQRKLGQSASVAVTRPGAGGQLFDYSSSWPSTIINAARLVRAAMKADVVHIHGGIRRGRVDLALVARVKPAVLHFHGSDAREGYGLHGLHLSRARIISTPDLHEHVPDAVYVPNPCTTTPSPWPENGPVRILHAPSNRALKGTPVILRVLDELRREGSRFELEVLEGVPREHVLEEMRRSHIVIDQFTVGGQRGPRGGMPGRVTFEALGIGRAVVLGMSTNARKYFSDLPLFTATTKEELKDVLRRLVEEPGRARDAGLLGPAVVARSYSPRIIAQRHIAIYERLTDPDRPSYERLISPSLD